jgi:hypothetical protein
VNPLRTLARTDAGHVRYVFAAWAIAVVPSLALYAARVAFGSASLHAQRGVEIAQVAAYSIVVAPLVETMVMVPLALALNALPAKSDWPRVFALAALAALAHGFGGTAWQVVAAFWPFVVYSAALFAWRRRSLQDAYLVAVLIHMLYNATFFAVGLAGALVANA